MGTGNTHACGHCRRKAPCWHALNTRASAAAPALLATSSLLSAPCTRRVQSLCGNAQLPGCRTPSCPTPPHSHPPALCWPRPGFWLAAGTTSCVAPTGCSTGGSCATASAPTGCPALAGSRPRTKNTRTGFTGGAWGEPAATSLVGGGGSGRWGECTPWHAQFGGRNTRMEKRVGLAPCWLLTVHSCASRAASSASGRLHPLPALPPPLTPPCSLPPYLHHLPKPHAWPLRLPALPERPQALRPRHLQFPGRLGAPPGRGAGQGRAAAQSRGGEAEQGHEALGSNRCT